jgi:type II secretory pathway component PulJ
MRNGAPLRITSSFVLHPSSFSSAFTLFEVILSLMILALLTGAVYSITSAATEASKATMEEQVSVRRMEAFFKVTRDAFLSLPREGTVQLRFSKSATGAPVPEIVFEEAAGLFGIPSLGGGSLILAARPRADGSRTMSLLRVPKGIQGNDLDLLKAGNSWVPLLPRVEKVKWSFFANGEWRDEWLPENGRPLTARLQMEYRDMAGSKIDAQFWIPPLVAIPQGQQPPPTPQPSPSP